MSWINQSKDFGMYKKGFLSLLLICSLQLMYAMDEAFDFDSVFFDDWNKNDVLQKIDAGIEGENNPQLVASRLVNDSVSVTTINTQEVIYASQVSCANPAAHIQSRSSSSVLPGCGVINFDSKDAELRACREAWNKRRRQYFQLTSDEEILADRHEARLEIARNKSRSIRDAWKKGEDGLPLSEEEKKKYQQHKKTRASIRNRYCRELFEYNERKKRIFAEDEKTLQDKQSHA